MLPPARERLGPVAVCPAMNNKMWQHPTVRQNVSALRERGVSIVEPGHGRLACGAEGVGRLADVDQILDAVDKLCEA